MYSSNSCTNHCHVYLTCIFCTRFQLNILNNNICSATQFDNISVKQTCPCIPTCICAAQTFPSIKTQQQLPRAVVNVRHLVTSNWYTVMRHAFRKPYLNAVPHKYNGFTYSLIPTYRVLQLHYNYRLYIHRLLLVSGAYTFRIIKKIHQHTALYNPLLKLKTQMLSIGNV